MSFLTELQAWHWLILALLLFGAEALGASGFLIGAGVAAVLQAAIAVIWPDISWQAQITTFAISAVIFSVLYWKLFRRFNEITDHSRINDRAAQMIGKRVTLAAPLAVGPAKLQLGDTLWSVRVDAAVEAGAQVEVYGYEGMVLLVRGMA